MSTPFIGITTYADDGAKEYSLPQQYVESIRRAGAIPLLVPPNETHLDKVLAKLDGLLLAGGGDLGTEHYGGQPHETIYNTDLKRDLTELALAKAVVDIGFPTLAICRGLQVANVALGGTLIEHLPDVVGETVLHRAPPREPTPHAVTLQSDSALAGIFGACEFSAQSWHHQAIRQLGKGLRIVAQAPDGTIEAAELPGHPWFFGVQWHPELSSETDPIQQRLFDAFVRAAIQRREVR